MISLKMKVPWAACAAFVLMAGAVRADVVLYATSREGQQLLKINVTTGTQQVLLTLPGFDNTPDSIVIDGLGRLVYTVSGSSQLRRFDPVAMTDVQLVDLKAFNGGLNSFPQDLVLDPTGTSVFVSNFTGGPGNGSITKTTLCAVGPCPTTLLTNILFPEGLAYDSAGRLFALVAFGTAADRIVQLDPTPGAIPAIIKTSASFDPTNTLDGLVFDSFTGLLYATSKNGNALYSIDPNPNPLVGTLLPTTIPIPTPDGVIADGNGLLYVAARFDFHVYQVNLAGGLPKVATQLVGAFFGLDDLGPPVKTPPTILKTFGALNLLASPGVPNTTSLNITITNSNTAPLNGVNFNDLLPAGLVVSTPPALSAVTCVPAGSIAPGVITATAGATSLSLTGATLAGNTSCSFSLNVTVPVGTLPGPQQNCVTAGAIGVGLGNTSCATLTVVAAAPILAPPVIAKSFNPTSVKLVGGPVSALTFSINNPNTTAPLTATGFNDVLPGGVVVSSPVFVSAVTCTTGTIGAGVINATALAGAVSLTGATINAGATCSFSVNVTGTTAGIKNNSVTVTDTIVGTGNTATAVLTVIAPPAISKFFGPGVVVGGTTSLTFNVTNVNPTTTLTGITFSDLIPAGLVISTPNGLTGSCGGGTIAAVAGTNLVTLGPPPGPAGGATLLAGASCSFTINVTGTALGPVVNITSIITSVEGGNGPPATAILTVIPPPDDNFQIRYASNLDKGDSVVNFTNAGTLNGLDPDGRICVNVYTFDPFEEMISCCACPVTPNGLISLSARNDLISNTLTPGKPTSITIKLLASTVPAGGICNAASPTVNNIAPGLRAWGTTLHALPSSPVTYGTTETPFARAELSPSELAKLTSYCGFIKAIGSGFGICKPCQTGGMGGLVK